MKWGGKTRLKWRKIGPPTPSLVPTTTATATAAEAKPYSRGCEVLLEHVPTDVSIANLQLLFCTVTFSSSYPHLNHRGKISIRSIEVWCWPYCCLIRECDSFQFFFLSSKYQFLYTKGVTSLLYVMRDKSRFQEIGKNMLNKEFISTWTF